MQISDKQSKLIKALTKHIRPYKKSISIPSEIELYNLIANVYQLRVSQLMYVSKSAVFNLLDFTKSIASQIKIKLDTNKYDFSLKELVMYIDSSMSGISENSEYSHGDTTESIFYASGNCTYKELLQSPTKFYESQALSTYNCKDYYFLPTQIEKTSYYQMALNVSIDELRFLNINTFYEKSSNELCEWYNN